MNRLLVSLVLISALTATPTPARATNPSNPYPNELVGFKFYAKYLSPLRPYDSDQKLVIHVLGSTQAIELSRWRMTPRFVGKPNTVNGHAWAHDITDRLADIVITPKKRVSMLRVKFPAAFTHALGSVSEINVSCDVYSDSFGLQYWLFKDDSAAGRKGEGPPILGPARE